MPGRTAVIIGAGPAGLTAAFELLARTDFMPVIYEASDDIGGISKTIVYKGNRIDIGGHRFFSKSDRVMDWWRMVMPFQAPGGEAHVTYRNQTRPTPVSAPDGSELVMLVRERLSRIFYLRKFFAYPVQMNLTTARQLGPVRIAKILLSYAWVRVRPIADEASLEDFFINRFGRTLYRTFFKDYTEKVWGVPCDQIKPDWGAQRIKGLSITKAALHAVKALLKPRGGGLAQKGVETSLIERFLYPKLGPGQMWEEVARRVQAQGGELHMGWKAVGARLDGKRVTAMRLIHARTGETREVTGDLYFSTMPIKDLIAGMAGPVPQNVRDVAGGLMYRDFVTVGLLAKKLKVKGKGRGEALIPDTWIYVQEPDVKLGRLQIFNNWSPYLVKDPGTVWMGLEYFCNVGDDLWSKADPDFIAFAKAELAKIGIIDADDVLDATILRVEKTYPAYFGTYDRFDELKAFFNSVDNLYLLGRNGMHRYNNSDHSMLTAMTAVDNIVAGICDKENIWAVNTEMDYHEEKK